LFDALDKLGEYDEKLLLKKLSGIEKPQLSNLKIHLYKEILASLRLLKSTDNIDLQLNEQLDYARILYNKGLYNQSIKILERAKETGRANNKFSYLTQVITLEKKIETLHITRSIRDRADKLAAEALEVSGQIDMVARLSNLSLQLYSWYIENGHARNKKDETTVRTFFNEKLPSNAYEQTGFYEKLYLFQSFCWYTFICQDFLLYYRYSQKWVDLFHEHPLMINVETSHYTKGLHNLLNAHFDLRNYRRFEITLLQLIEFSKTDIANQHDSSRIQIFVYINSAKVNQHLMLGTFKEGISLVKYIDEKMQEYAMYLDRHRLLVFNYKIATLYFGSGDYNTCIDYLQRIINDHADLRSDLQCYARLLHLLAHYELGNFEIIEYLAKSVYRFMARMENLSVVEEEMFKFLRKSFHVSRHKIKPELKNFLEKIKQFEQSRFETRAFAYLDIISWLESKVYEKPMSEILKEKVIHSKKRNYLPKY
jgi:hypothetical protein